eukprot:COSAG04_NODE_4289_length_2181_cov_11.770413_2_plen_126_part_00
MSGHDIAAIWVAFFQACQQYYIVADRPLLGWRAGIVVTVSRAIIPGDLGCILPRVPAISCEQVAYTMLVTPVYLIFFGMEHAVRVEAESLWTTIVVILWCEAHAAIHHPIRLSYMHPLPQTADLG